jgi:hypothetical protein
MGIIALAGASVACAALALAPHAGAVPGSGSSDSMAPVALSWNGPNNCIDIQAPPEGNYYVIGKRTVCAMVIAGQPHPNGYELSWVSAVQPGQYYGASIPLTDESEVHCKVWLNGVLQGTDDAYANQGSGSADCTRKAS